jgi:hypothetical protein
MSFFGGVRLLYYIVLISLSQVSPRRNTANFSLDIRTYLPDLLERVKVLVNKGQPLDELLPDRWASANPGKVFLNRDLENP